MNFRRPLCLFSFALQLAAAPAGAAPRKVATIEGITEYDLDNGLRVLCVPDSTRPTVTVNVTYLVGSRHEGQGESGMAHLLEHLLFKGTATRDNLLGVLQTRGAIANGSTDYDRTNYYETLPAGAGNLEFALALEADRMVHGRIARADLEKEFSVVRNEFEMDENNPEEVLRQRMYHAAYLWHAYGKTPIGSRSDIENVPIDRLQSFYRHYYQPDNAVVVIAGKFEEVAGLAAVERTLGRIARPERRLTTTYTVEPVQDGERQAILRRAGQVAMAGILYHGVAGADADHVAEEALIETLTAQPAGRLYRALVTAGLATDVRGEAPLLRDPGWMELRAKVSSGQSLESVRAAMSAIVEGLGVTPISDEELVRFQTRRKKEFEVLTTQSERLAVELSEWAALGDWRLLFVHRDRVQQLTTADVRRVATRYLKPSNRTVGLFIPTAAPDRSPLPERPDVAALVANYRGGEVHRGGEEFVATLENIEKRTVRWTLPSGMKVAALPKASRGGAVKGALAIHFGSESELRGKLAATLLLPKLLLRGTRKRDLQKLKDELDRLTAELKVGGDGFEGTRPGVAQLVFTTVKSHVPEMIALVAEVLEQPAFPPADFAIVKRELLTRLEEESSSPEAQGFRTLMRKLSPYPAGDVRYVPTTKEMMDAVRAVRLEEIVELHRRLWGAASTELAIVGDVDVATLRPSLDESFGHWRSERPFQRIASPFQQGVPASEERVPIPDQQTAMVAVAHALELRDDDPDYPALQLINFILGGAFKSRLTDRLRQKDGLSYHAFSFIDADSFDRRGMLLAAAMCAPQNANRAMGALVEEIERLIKDGVPPAELDEAKKSYRMLFDNLLARDGYIARQLGRGLYTGRTLDFHRRVNARIESLTREELSGVLKRYIDPSKLVRVYAGDWKN